MLAVYMVLVFTFGLTLSMLFIPFLIRFAAHHGLTEGNDHRKLHREKVSTLGGIGIFAGALLALVPAFLSGERQAFWTLCLALPLLMVGILDDLYKVSVRARFGLQFLSGAALYFFGLRFNAPDLPWYFNLALTMLFTTAVVNAYNLIDGINGLAGSLGLLGSLGFGAWFLWHGNAPMALLALALAGGQAGFLRFNFGRRAQIFMGDNGSTVLGFSVAAMTLAVFQTSAQAPVAFIWSLLFIPFTDAVKVALFRALRGASPFHADRTHIHHLLTDRGRLSHPASCAVLLGLNVAVVATGMWTRASVPVFFMVVTAALPYVAAQWVRPVRVMLLRLVSAAKRETMSWPWLPAR